MTEPKPVDPTIVPDAVPTPEAQEAMLPHGLVDSIREQRIATKFEESQYRANSTLKDMDVNFASQVGREDDVLRTAAQGSSWSDGNLSLASQRRFFDVAGQASGLQVGEALDKVTKLKQDETYSFALGEGLSLNVKS